MEHEEHIQSLIDDLQDRDYRVQRRAMDELAQIGEPALPALLVALRENDRNEEMIMFENPIVRTTLIRMGEPAFQALGQALKAPDKLGRAAVKALVRWNDSRAVGPLVEVMLDKNGHLNTRLYAIDALAYFQDASAFEPLVDALQDEPIIRIHAARALGLYRDARALEPLRIARQAPGTTHLMSPQEVEETFSDSIRAISDKNFTPRNRGFFLNSPLWS